LNQRKKCKSQTADELVGTRLHAMSYVHFSFRGTDEDAR
jgi:hypothetical protein